jgi:hypothetical protein
MQQMSVSNDMAKIEGFTGQQQKAVSQPGIEKIGGFLQGSRNQQSGFDISKLGGRKQSGFGKGSIRRFL